MEKSKTSLADVLEKSVTAADRLEHKDLIFNYGGTGYPTTLHSWNIQSYGVFWNQKRWCYPSKLS